MNRHDSLLTDADRKRETWFEVESAPLVILQAKKAMHFRIVLDRNVTLGIVGGESGREILLRVEQGGSGGFTLTLDSAVSGTVSITTTAGSVSYVRFLYNEGRERWEATPVSDLTKALADTYYQPLDADLTAIAALTTAAYGRGFLQLDAEATGRTYIGATAAGSALLTAASAAAQRTALGLGTAYAANIAAADADSTAAVLADLVADHNDLLAKLRAAGLMAT